MKCEKCVEAGLRSFVYPGITFVTSMISQSFYDEDGIYHHHDPNWHSSSWSCSQGHRWEVRSLHPCSACGLHKKCSHKGESVVKWIAPAAAAPVTA